MKVLKNIGIALGTLAAALGAAVAVCYCLDKKRERELDEFFDDFDDFDDFEDEWDEPCEACNCNDCNCKDNAEKDLDDTTTA